MKILVFVIRIVISFVFIFSGFVKLIDPIGSQYKFEEYFSESVLNIAILIPYSLPFSIFLILLELILGIIILIGYKPKKTSYSLLFLTLIFLFLTWYSAYYNKVTDCGCFGDAIKMSPWEAFYKNVILILLIVFLIIKQNLITPIFKDKTLKIIILICTFLSLFIVQHVLTHLPIIDFRAFAVGKNITKGMEYPKDGSLPAIHDFMLTDAESDLTKNLLQKEKLLLIIIYDLDKADKDGFLAIKNISLTAKQKGYTVYGVSSSFADDLTDAIKKYNLPFEFLFCDGTTLKTMIRANPGIIILNKGTIIQKKNWIDAEKIKL